MKGKRRNFSGSRPAVHLSAVFILAASAFAWWGMAASPSLGQTQPPRLLRIGTGGRTGVYYPVGRIIARGLTADASVKESGGTGEQGVPGCVGSFST